MDEDELMTPNLADENVETIELEKPKRIKKEKQPKEYVFTDKRQLAFEKMIKAKNEKRLAGQKANVQVQQLKKYLQLKAYLKQQGIELDDKIVINESKINNELQNSVKIPDRLPDSPPSIKVKKPRKAKTRIVIEDETDTPDTESDYKPIKMPRKKSVMNKSYEPETINFL